MRTYNLLLALVLAGLSAALAQPPAPSEDDSSAIEHLFSQFSRIWDEPGMPGFGELFSDDADFVVISGKWLKGRDEIVNYHKTLLATTYQGSRSIPMKAVGIRFLTPALAVAHVTSGAHYTHDGIEQTR